jgi:hypothetical protein
MLLQVFFMNHLLPSPNNIRIISIYFGKFAKIFTSQGAPQVSMTPAANFSTSTAGGVDTSGKFDTGVHDSGGIFAAGVNDTGGKLPPVSTTPVANN